MTDSGSDSPALSAYDIQKKSEYLKAGLLFSVLCHLFLVYCIYRQINSEFKPRGKQVVYSISVESSAKLGGIQQVPDKNFKKTKEVAPPKQVAKPPKEKPKAPKKKEKAEVRIPLNKPTPKPTPKPKPTPQPEKKPTPKPTKTPEKKATPKPTKTPEKKPTPKPTAKPEPKVEKTPTPKPTPKKEPKPTPDAKSKEAESKKPKATPKPTKSAESKKPAKPNYQDAIQKYLGESSDAGGSGFGSAGTGAGTGFGGGTQRPPAWFTYIDDLTEHIKRGWNWHDQSRRLYSVIGMKIARDGTLSKIRLVESSGNSKYDDSVLRAVRKANPVPPPLAQLYAAYGRDFDNFEIGFEPDS